MDPQTDRADQPDRPDPGDPCDGCGSRTEPLVLVLLGSGSSLVFCGACWERHSAAVRAAAAAVRG